MTAPDVSALETKLGRKMAAPQEAREGENVEVRLRHMDQLGVDVQVLWPTLFLERVADRPEAEIAVCRSYNRWLADIWRQAKGRLRWACVLPLQTMSEALDQLRLAHANASEKAVVQRSTARKAFRMGVPRDPASCGAAEPSV